MAADRTQPWRGRGLLDTGHRTVLTKALSRPLAALQGVVVDVGGGPDAPHDATLGASARRVRIDLSPAHHPDAVADAVHLPLPDATADAVLLVEVLEHVRDPAGTIAEARRILRPGGTLLGTIPFAYGLHESPADLQRFTADGLDLLLSAFDDVRVVPMGNGASHLLDRTVLDHRWLWPLMPLVRRANRRTDYRFPQGYLFEARRPTG